MRPSSANAAPKPRVSISAVRTIATGEEPASVAEGTWYTLRAGKLLP